MTKALILNESTEQGILDFLKNLLETRQVRGILTLKKINKNNDVAYSIITDVKELNDAVPFYPLMPVNAGKLLSRFTFRGGPSDPIIAVVKPCELRGFVELIKREQGCFDNLFIISFTCGGVFPQQMSVEKTVEKNLNKYWDSVKKAEISDNIRPACKGCEEFIPYNSDFTVDLIGRNDLDKQSIILINNEKGAELTKNMKGKFSEESLNKEKLEKFRNKREIEKKKLFKEIDEKIKDIDGLIDVFGRCIGCHGCMRVCPICYCNLCEFESSDSEYKPSNYESDLKKRGGIRVPPGTVYYHLGRLSHIGISCVACGLCEDVCPVDIPISIIFKKIGESVQKVFDYIPGKNIDEDIPLMTFEKEELLEFED